MEVRERDLVCAIDVARRLAQDFPDNRELATFQGSRSNSATMTPHARE
jgi:hypothetical protein